MNIIARAATRADKDFLITAIIGAEKSGSDVISYCRMFDISEDELRALLSDILEDDIAGQELCISSFQIGEVDGVPAAAINSWIEGASGISSGIIKSSLFFKHVDREKLMRAMPAMKLIASINPPRTPGTMQLEAGYTADNYRGLGLFSLLVHANIKARQAEGIPFSTMEAIIMGSNEKPKSLYKKLGFVEIKEVRTNDPRILELLPGDSKIQMEYLVK